MVLEIDSSVSSLHLPCVLLSICNSVLDVVAVSEIEPLAKNQDLCHSKSSERERVTEDIRTLSIDLSCYYTSGVADGLLEANCSGSAVLWCNIDVQPTHVQSRSIVDCHSTQESAQELDSVWRRTDDQDITNDTENVGKGYQRSTNSCSIREPSDDQKGETAKDVYWDRKILRLKGVVTQGFDDRWQEGRESIEKDILTESGYDVSDHEAEACTCNTYWMSPLRITLGSLIAILTSAQLKSSDPM
jgi:hypothetical protein